MGSTSSTVNADVYSRSSIDTALNDIIDTTSNTFALQAQLLWNFDPAKPDPPKKIVDLRDIAPKPNPTFTRTMNGISKAMINLAHVLG